MRCVAHELWEDDLGQFEVEAFVEANIAEVGFGWGWDIWLGLVCLGPHRQCQHAAT